MHHPSSPVPHYKLVITFHFVLCPDVIVFVSKINYGVPPMRCPPKYDTLFTFDG